MAARYRPVLIGLFCLLLIPVFAALSVAEPGTNNGSYPCSTDNGEYVVNPSCGSHTPPPTTAPLVLNHVPNASYLGQYLAGGTGTVTQAQIRSNLSYAIGGLVGFGADRATAVGDQCLNTCAGSYWDFMRPDASATSAPGTVILSDPGYNEGCGSGTAWFYHSSCSPVTRATPRASVYVNNFGNAAEIAWWRNCFDATGDANQAQLCNTNASSKAAGGDSGPTRTYNDNDFMMSDTSAVLVAALTQSGSCMVEACSDSALQSQQTNFFNLAPLHANGSPIPVWVNGVNRGVTKSPTTNKGSCATATQSCLTLIELPNVSCGIYEFFGENQVTGAKLTYQGEFMPWSVNSATAVIADGRCIVELIEFESSSFDQHTTMLGTSQEHMLSWICAFLLTYNPQNPGQQISWLDVESHLLSDSKNRLPSWPAQTVTPAGAVAIQVTPYSPGTGVTGGFTNHFGIDGCLNQTGPSGETDSGGIISYFMLGSCAKADDGSTWIGTYGNASTSCPIGGVAIGPCMYFTNPSAKPYVVPCSEITRIGLLFSPIRLWTSLTFTHHVNIGQDPGATFNDVLPSDGTGGGGTLTYNDTTNSPFLCGDPVQGVVPADGGLIIY
jgi:hypothetical protein